MAALLNASVFAAFAILAPREPTALQQSILWLGAALYGRDAIAALLGSG